MTAKPEQTLADAHLRIVELIKEREERITTITRDLRTVQDKIAGLMVVPNSDHKKHQIALDHYASQGGSLISSLVALNKSVGKMKEEEKALLEVIFASHEHLLISERDILKKRVRVLEQGFADGIGTGCIIIDLPESQKSLFQDLLKGFADYAGTLGYGLSFSVDTSVTNKFAFKFTFQEGSISVPPQQVRDDFAEYYKAVEKGEPLTELPKNCSLEQQTLYLRMSNKITQLHADASMFRNLSISNEAVIQKLLNGTFSFVTDCFPMPHQQALLQAGQGNQAAQGSGINFSGTIQIGQTEKEREPQVQALENLLKLIVTHQPDASAEITQSLKKAAHELKAEEPDPHRVGKWLETAKYGLKALGLVKEVKDAAAAAWIVFNLVFS